MIEPFVPFSVRSHISSAIENPGSVTARYTWDDGRTVEDKMHWAARAALDVIEAEAVRSPIFSRWLAMVAASGIEARQRTDPEEGLDPEGESPAPKADAQRRSA